MENYRFLAPHVAIVSTPKGWRLWGLDGAFVTAFTLAAQVGGATIPQAAIAGMCSVVRSKLNISRSAYILPFHLAMRIKSIQPINPYHPRRVGRSGRYIINKTQGHSQALCLSVVRALEVRCCGLSAAAYGLWR